MGDHNGRCLGCAIVTMAEHKMNDRETMTHYINRERAVVIVVLRGDEAEGFIKAKDDVVRDCVEMRLEEIKSMTIDGANAYVAGVTLLKDRDIPEGIVPVTMDDIQ